MEDIESSVYTDRLLKANVQLITHTYGRPNRDPAMMLSGAVV